LLKKLITNFLSDSQKNFIRNSIERIDLILVRICSNNRILSSLYFLVFSNQFHREHKAVLKGRLSYHESLTTAGNSSVLLRRNIHRLEKGLVMRPRRDVFAEAFIKETAICYVKCTNDNEHCLEELKWAFDTFNVYFAVVGNTPVIDAARKVFATSASKPLSSKQGVRQSFSPYLKKDSNVSSVSFEQLEGLFNQRRSVRWFKKKEAPIDLINEAVRIAKQAPSACNRLPYKFLVSSESDRVKKIADCAMGTAGFSDNIPCIITVVGDLSAYPAERDRHVIYIDASLAAMQLMLAFETLGLSSCPINWPDIESREKKLSELLNLSYTERPVMLIAVGYADPEGMIPFSLKKKNALLVKEI
jgi:nitroreductase